MRMSSRQQRDASAGVDLFERMLARVSLWTLLVALGLSAVLIATIRAVLGDTDVRRLLENAVVCCVFICWVRFAVPASHSLRDLAGPLPRGSSWGWLLGLALTQHLLVGSLLQLSWRTGWPLVRGDEVSWLSSGRMSWVDGAYFVLVAVVLGPLTEELVFRGVLFRRWRGTLGPRQALLISSLLFGCLHANHMLVSCLQGALLALLYARAGTLWAPFLAHALQNGLALAFGAMPASYIAGTPGLVALLALGVVALGLFARWFWPALSSPLPPLLRGQAAAEARSSEDGVRVAPRAEP